MTDQPQQPEQPASRRSRTRGRDGVSDDAYVPDRGHGRDFDNLPKADPELTERFERLELALHGRRTPRDARRLVWSGVIEPAVTFESIVGQLELPPDRPTSDLPPESDGSPSGG